jgi:hypothetical protein
MSEKTSTQLLLESLAAKLEAKPSPRRKLKRPAPTVVLVDGQECLSIPLTRGMFSIIDKADGGIVTQCNWFAASGGSGLFYAAKWMGTYPNRILIKLHRYLLGLTDPEIESDHKNGNSLDNRRSNLRKSSHIQNVRNRAINLSSKSGIKGVTKTANGKWRARIGVNYEAVWLGVFESQIDAANAYREAAQKFYGEFAVHNRQQIKPKEIECQTSTT